MMDQSDVDSAGMFSRWTNQTQEAWVYSRVPTWSWSTAEAMTGHTCFSSWWREAGMRSTTWSSAPNWSASRALLRDGAPAARSTNG
eukprot:1186040-Prorocentrum_minimum.AAC.9